ncbi:MAG TPA: NfeD family protein [Bdellovibrionota bacterium]|nr:NfeD family protein [Bdellovibrionota bacterium]
MTWRALVLGLVLWAPLALGATVTRIRIHDAIHVGTFEYLKRAVATSEKNGDAGLLVELDTPGGYLEATREIVQLMLSSKHPIAIWVTPSGARAASAGAMITMAAHLALMSPSTSIGAATPVDAGGGDVGESMKNKVINDTVSFVEGIAAKRGRNASWAKASVTEAASLSASEAKAKNVIDHVVDTEAQLKEILAREWKTSEIQWSPLEPRMREQFISFFANPNIAYALLGLGALGIYVEMTHPGLIFPGAIGAISLALGAMTTKIIPINTAAIALLVLALLLFAIEIFVPAPTFGVAGTAGLVSLFFSGVLLLDPSQTNLKLDPLIWLPLFAVVASFMGWLMTISIRALRAKPYRQGVDGLLGKVGSVSRVVENELYQYKVLVAGELWNANADTPLAVHDTVVVVQQSGFLLTVKKESSHV